MSLEPSVRPPEWVKGPPPKGVPGLYVVVITDGRTGKPMAPMLARFTEWMQIASDILWHMPIPEPSEAPNAE